MQLLMLITGHYRAAAGGQGKRTDLEDACTTLRDTKSLKRVAQEHPTAFVKFHKGLKELKAILEEPELDDKEFRPRNWQQRVLNLVLAAPDDRTIIWVHETVGNVGKSRLARHLLIEHGATFLTGKLADMCHAYERHPIVCFDITRAQAEFSDNVYTMCEWLKNGFFMKTKYESKQYIFKPPHVVIFSNGLPGEGKWSLDRLKLVNLEEPEWHQETILHHVNRVRGNNSPPGSPIRVAAEDSD